MFNQVFMSICTKPCSTKMKSYARVTCQSCTVSSVVEVSGIGPFSTMPDSDMTPVLLSLVLGLKDSLRTICKPWALKVQALAMLLRVLALALKSLGLGLGFVGLGPGSAASHLVTSFTSHAFAQLVHLLLLSSIEKYRGIAIVYHGINMVYIYHGITMIHHGTNTW